MNLNLSDNELDFLVRAIVSNYGQLPKDYEQDIASKGVGEEIIGTIVMLDRKYKQAYLNAKKESSISEPINQKLFCGAGWVSGIVIAALHKRLMYAVKNLSAMQQNGIMGSEYDKQMEIECRTEIKSVVKDLMFAFDLSVEDILND